MLCSVCSKDVGLPVQLGEGTVGVEGGGGGGEGCEVNHRASRVLIVALCSACSKDVRLPVQLQRAMAAEAEASREARAKVSSFAHERGFFVCVIFFI